MVLPPLNGVLENGVAIDSATESRDSILTSALPEDFLPGQETEITMLSVSRMTKSPFRG
jgi:hypothetical protein